jgi:hypothetical protein
LRCRALVGHIAHLVMGLRGGGAEGREQGRSTTEKKRSA